MVVEKKKKKTLNDGISSWNNSEKKSELFFTYGPLKISAI